VREVLADGDILNVDVTTCLDGVHGDTSATFFIGTPSPEARHVVETALACLEAGVSAVRPGGTLLEVATAIESVARAAGCSVVETYGGHGIGRRMHEPPFVAHTPKRAEHRVLQPGMIFTIEPMINLGSPEVDLLPDGWTVVTRDGGLSAQFEHTVLVTRGGVEILTLPR
jgi:methionyl aminopeptidase